MFYLKLCAMGNYIHYIKNGSTSFVFDNNKMELYSADSFNEAKFILPKVMLEHKNLDLPFSHKMKRITLCVSNDCDLRCKYCYAHGGNYGQNRLLMNEKTALDFVDFCYRELAELDNVMFFGGEPLLNWKIIMFICEEFSKRQVAGGHLNPKFSMVTNGTIYNDKICQLIRQYICDITVSIDGKEDVDNYNRIYPNGAGSFGRVSRFIYKVKQIEGVNLHFEATYTKIHEKLGYTRYDVKKYLTSHFGITGTVVDDTSLDFNSFYKELSSITKEKILSSDFDCLPNDFWQILYSIAEKKKQKFCSVLEDRITISTTGEIFACQMLNGKKKCIAGTIYDRDILERIYSNRIFFGKNEACDACWANSLCGGCVVQKFYNEQSGLLNDIPSQALCINIRNGIEKLLSILYQIRNDSELWHRLLHKMAS